MKRPDANRRPKAKAKRSEGKAPPSRFAPAAFLKGSPESVRQLCQELASASARRFVDLTGTDWERAVAAIVSQLRAAGHDLMSLEESAGLQEWQASWHHPRGAFSLLLSFRAPGEVEVTWKRDDETFTARG